jgi:hypothetical protein
MRAGGNAAKVGKDSPQGDLSKRDDPPFNKFFKRKIRPAGSTEFASDYLPVRPFAKAGGDNS